MKTLGGTLIGIVMAAFLIILPWRGADALSARRPAFRHWYEPRRLRFRVGWTLASLCFGAAAGFGALGFAVVVVVSVMTIVLVCIGRAALSCALHCRPIFVRALF